MGCYTDGEAEVRLSRVLEKKKEKKKSARLKRVALTSASHVSFSATKSSADLFEKRRLQNTRRYDVIMVSREVI